MLKSGSLSLETTSLGLPTLIRGKAQGFDFGDNSRCFYNREEKKTSRLKFDPVPEVAIDALGSQNLEEFILLMDQGGERELYVSPHG